MLKKTLIASLLATSFGVPAAQAAEPESPHTLTGNVGIFSQYIFRGLTQTNKDPALQGGFDYSHSSGFYLGTWASNISWLTDSSAATGYTSSSLEWDFYGGFKGSIGSSDFGYDVGLLQYYYPGTHDSSIYPTKANTLEIYGALSWKWLSVKYSHSLDNKTFGVADSRGTYYLDLSATVPVTDKFNLLAHWGKQKFDGTTAGVSNDSFASYEDWKLGVTFALPKDFTVGAFYTGTSMNATQKAFYTNASDNRMLGKDAFVVYLQKTF
jgi:uncharacterized protein (TIGR02001 family)